jgi:predicted cupin superfamily sugar epimerase
VNPDVRQLIADLRLRAHPEGGFFRETYRSATRIATPRGERAAITSIHFLLPGDTFSAWHTLRSDETWHFYRGSALTLHTIAPDGRAAALPLGPDGPYQLAIPAGTAFAAAVDDPAGYALVGCDVAPGFEFADFDLHDRAALLAAHPQHAALVSRFARPIGTTV